jgi:hypothetical protein
MKLRIFASRATALATGILTLAITSIGVDAAELRSGEVSFTVRTLREENVEGPDVERTYFMAAGKRIAFGIPKGCLLKNEDGGLLISPAVVGIDGKIGRLDGEIHVSRSTFTPEWDLTADALKYRDAAAKEVPRGATEIKVQQPVLNAYPYNGWKSLAFTWTYSLYGRSMVRTVSYINLEIGVQIMVTTLAVENDAQPVDKIAKQFMSSWWVMRG